MTSKVTLVELERIWKTYTVPYKLTAVLGRVASCSATLSRVITDRLAGYSRASYSIAMLNTVPAPTIRFTDCIDVLRYACSIASLNTDNPQTRHETSVATAIRNLYKRVIFELVTNEIDF